MSLLVEVMIPAGVVVVVVAALVVAAARAPVGDGEQMMKPEAAQATWPWEGIGCGGVHVQPGAAVLMHEEEENKVKSWVEPRRVIKQQHVGKILAVVMNSLIGQLVKKKRERERE